MTDITFQIIYDSRRKLWLVIGDPSGACYGEYETMAEADNEKYNLELGDRT